MSTGVPIKTSGKVTPPPRVKVTTTTDEVVNDIKIGNKRRVSERD
jgi:hypothetical protein